MSGQDVETDYPPRSHVRGKGRRINESSDQERMIREQAQKMLIDRGERIRLAGIAARHEGRFKMALGRELKAIGLSLLGLRLTLGICYPDELTPSAINRIFNYLSLAQPIQGQRPAPVERLTAVINALNSLSTHVHQHSRRE